MTRRTALSKGELKAWKEYDQTFSDPMEHEGVEDFEDLEKDVVPVDNWGAVTRFGGVVIERVGNGAVTDEKTCGKFLGKVMGCLNVDLHAHVSLDGVDHTGKIPLKKIFMSCDKPDCPECFKRGYANREAVNASVIIEKVSRGYTDKNGKKHMGLGVAEHIINSVPESDYVLTFARLKAKSMRVLRSRGVIGGALIFHLQRYRNFYEAKKVGGVVGWYVAPHWHIVGFIEGGYASCRGCSNTYEGQNEERKVIDTEKCLACKDGFEGLTRRQFALECSAYAKKMKVENNGRSGGWIVKVMGKRKSVQSTFWYQINHASFVKREGSRHDVVTWFGVCGCRKMALTKEDKVHRCVCPICLYDMEEVKRVGGEDVDWWVKEWEESYLDKNGSPKWVPVPKLPDKWHKGVS